MNIRSIKGDIAELSVLWIGSGFNRRFTTWKFGIRTRYPALTTLEGEIVAGKPWLAPRIKFFEDSRPVKAV
jgi:hypothetical protein